MKNISNTRSIRESCARVLAARVLFVDDEPDVLQALRRSLHSLSDQWKMAFAGSGAEALALLEGSSFDVIVSDLRMPEMDGAELLERVRTHYPGMIRIALSGCLEREAALRASGVVHQYLAKPCDSTTLIASIERFCSWRSVLPHETARRVVGAIGSLPSLPQTASALVDAMRKNDVGIDQVGAIIARDVGMAAKVLQLVNSPLFASQSEVTGLHAAIALMGLDSIKHIVLFAEAFRAFEPEQPIEGFSLAGFEAHSALTARIADNLPLPMSILPASFTAAFLHDVGKLVLAMRLPKAFERNLKLAREQKRPLHLVESESIDTNHAEVGAYLLSLWGLAPAIVGAVRHHHQPLRVPAAGGLDIAGIVHVADALAYEFSAEDEAEAGRGLLNEQYLAAQGVISQLPNWRGIAQRSVSEPSACALW